ncbi:YhgE/Pip domain-containing protein [Allosalinactinospora lopnorensis]|uniref:YhgE/Pip domain-containing protein n=1 Tax=Allosalinactinospora lopnorensis TaxID=1352348 RepID=UPI000623D7C0|nr:YhgE/Pip domain-containing protein [Allosalinactinospora lopnorensis]
MTRPRFRPLPTLRLGRLSVLSFFRSPLPAAALAALALVPLLYSGLYLWSFWDPFGRMGNLPVALVNEDEPVTVDGEELNAGQQITDELLEGGELDWHLVDSGEAASGVAEGRYYVSLTIPEDFSTKLAAPSDEEAEPIPARLEAHYNDANSYIVRQLLSSAFTEVRNAVGTSAISDYLDRMFLGFNEIQEKTEEAADGAGELADGTGDAKDGSGELYNGLGEAKEGSGSLHSGLGELYDGSKELAEGSTAASRDVSDKVESLDTLVDDWGPKLREDAPKIQTHAEAVSEAADSLSEALDELPDNAAADAEQARAVQDDLEGYLEDNPDLEETDPELHRLLTEAASVAAKASDANDFIQQNRDEIADMSSSAATASELAADLAEEAPDLADDAEAARDQVDALDEGLAEIAKGNRELRDGLKTAYSGSADLDEGVGDLRSGAGELDDGLADLQDGSEELSGGLTDGAEEIPTFDSEERGARGDMMSEPVRLSSDVDNKAPDYGTGFAPFFVPLSLWIGAMVVFMVVPALPRRALATASPSWRITLAGWIPPMVIGLAQVAVMLTALHFLLGLDAERWPGLVGLLALTAAVFAAIVQWANVAFGPSGRIVALVLLVLQLTSAGGTYPIETSPGFFQAVAPYLPMHWTVSALRHLISGGDLGVVWQACWVLGGYLAASLLLTWLSVARKRVWTMKELHPPLKL